MKCFLLLHILGINQVEIDRMTDDILFLKEVQLLKYDLSHYKQKSYVITLKDDIRESDEFKSVELISPNKLMISSTDLTETLALLNRDNHQFRDIENNLTGSEDLYQEIYL